MSGKDEPGNSGIEAAKDNLDIVQTLFEHRLHQSDLDRILQSLSTTDRDEFISKVGDLLNRISALIEVSNRVSDSLSLDVLLPRMIEIMTDAMAAERSSLFVYDEETETLFSRVAQGSEIGEIRFPADVGIAGDVFTNDKAEIIDDAYADDRFNQAFDKQTGFRTRNILCAPLKNKNGKVIGVSQVLNKKAGDFDPSDLSLLEGMTSQAASAIENAQLFETVERQRQEESQMLEITQAISSNLKLGSLLARIIETVTDMLNADRSTLFMYDPKTQELWSRIAEGMATKEIRFPANAGLAGACFTQCETINIPDCYADDRFNQEVDRKTGYRTQNMLCMPVVNKDGETLGVIQVLNHAGGPFKKPEENRLAGFAAQAAIAIQNAQLFEAVLNERNYNENILRSMSNGVITLDAADQPIKVNAAAAAILHLGVDSKTWADAAKNLINSRANHWISDSLSAARTDCEAQYLADAEIAIDTIEKVSTNTTVVPLFDGKQTMIGSMMIIEDLTSEKRVRSTMARYMSPQVAEQLLESGGDQLGGANQVASVLFSDIRSFTTLSEELGPKETVSMLNEYFTDMMEVISEYDGILDKYIGDAIMALYGTPFPGPRDTDNAVQSAMKMMTRLRIFNQRRKHAGKNEVIIGIGISTGDLVVGNIGSPKRMDYTVIGDTVNLAARLEGATKMYGAEIVVSEPVLNNMTDSVLTRELDLIRVKGKVKPVPIYEVLGYHLNGEFPNQAETLGHHAEGMSHYRNRDWAKAENSFNTACQARGGADGPSEMMIDRCRYFASQPPPEDWGGIWTAQGK